MKIKIYQIDGEKDKNGVKFMRYDRLAKLQGSARVAPSLYTEVYAGDIDAEGLEEIYRSFNTGAVPLHRGHSLSVSDVVRTEDGAFYCDSFGFQKIDFDESLAQKPDGLLRILYVEPNKRAVIAEMESGLPAIPRAVKGHYEQIYMDENTVVLCNEEGKLNGMEGNRRYNDGKNIIAGSFVVIGSGEEDYVSLTDEQVEKYMGIFGQPEEISEEETQADVGFKFYSW